MSKSFFASWLQKLKGITESTEYMKLSILFVCLFVVENNNGNSGNDNNVLVDSFARSRNLSSHFITEPLPYLCFSNYLKIPQCFSLLIARSHLVDCSTQLTHIFIFQFLYFVFHDKYPSYKYEKIQQLPHELNFSAIYIEPISTTSSYSLN